MPANFRSLIAALSFLYVVGTSCAALSLQTEATAGADKSAAKPPVSASGSGNADAASSAGIQEGDLVSLNFTASTGNGEIVRTTIEKVSQDPAWHKSAYFSPGPAFSPEDVIAGRDGSIRGLGEAVIGMTAGGKKTVVLPPEKAFGPADPSKKKEMPCVRNIPRSIMMSPKDYVNDFQTFPVLGKEVPITPYFNAKVVEISEQFARLDCSVTDGAHFEENFGSIEIKADEKNISMVLTPSLGANFPMGGGQQGRVVATDGVTFTVDANNPLASLPITVDLEVVAVTRAARLNSVQIQWAEGYEQGIAQAREQKKDAILVLYADWCPYCKKLFGETLQDPRVKALKDRFVWIKVNSDADKKFKEMFDQKGFPLIVVLNRDGQPADRMDGFKDAIAFRDELVKVAKSL